MSSIKLKHSGGNSVSISAPSSNPSSDKTITLPNDESGQIITSDRSGTTLQRQFKYLTSNTQLAKGGSIGELNSDLRIDFTPKAADSNLLLEFFAPFVFPNSTNLQYCLFYDNTAGAGVSLPPAVGSRVRCHWTNRNGPNDANDNDALNMRIVTPASNTNARQYTIRYGTEGASAQFFVSTLSTGGGSVYPMTFVITEIAA
jgi:hypothetical protein|tara:strand:- start:1053 stop:1655 length:603 start_codon:yes stop_codon:yes gene_type:complete